MTYSYKDTVRSKALGRLDTIAPKTHKALRKSGRPGVVTGILDTMILVKHPEDSGSAIYWEDELEPQAAIWTLQWSVQGVSYFREFLTHGDATDYVDSFLPSQDEGLGGWEITGPLYEDRALADGVMPTQDVYDHLLGDDDF